ncbi:MAG: M48 family metallopeptidase [Candidatus Symbiothrix sp.]|jgi:predicted metal-dependent hydrolase|nr:M48 family metallopeptidase [Candidatus Symbiothrix sp.]
MMETLIYGTTEITYSIDYSNRKTLGISVNPDGKVIVNAPVDTFKEKIEEKIIKRAPWILKQQRFFTSFGEKMPPRRYISGESHLYLGKQYILRVTEGKHNSVSFKGHSFVVETLRATSPKNATSVERLMKEWYKERAKTKFAEIAEPIIQRFKKYGVEPTLLYIQNMENRWGSCTPKGKIILNTELIKAPKPCIEYVIMHELCHLVHQRHTHAFYDLLTTEMPDWERWKNKLEQLMH